MNRKDFFKNACKYGVCGCAGYFLLTSEKVYASAENTEKKEEDWRIGFMQKRFAKLVESMNNMLDERYKLAILENMGRICARENNQQAVIFKNDLKGFLAYVQEKWVEKAEYNEETNEIHIVDKKRETCFCPFVNHELTPRDFCNCSIGWQKENYETIIGKPVLVNINSSILHGAEQCSFTIHIL